MKNTYSEKEWQAYLQPTPFIDSDHPDVIDFARSTCGSAGTDLKRGIKLYYRIRDMIRYSPYSIGFDPERYKASWLLREKTGFCIQKAILLTAAARAVFIPSRLGFADVRNHLATERLKALMRTDEFVFHGYTELFLAGKWVKATPAFNLALCEKFGVKPLEFDGRNDSVFHPFDRAGNKHMEYIRDHGQFADFPLEKMIRALEDGYPHLFHNDGPGWPIEGDFEREAGDSQR
ncbi:MAG: transglutaminase family protein [Candidatus Aminicenantes bacterium]|nr:transglutaminase family protein [Candidatus Aminicenantes bacterium]